MFFLVLREKEKMSNPWVQFLKRNGGKGLTTSQLKNLYKSQQKSRSRSRTKPKVSKKLCRKRLSKKISINIKENRWPRKQAIAVSYSQIRKKYPQCISKL